MQLAGVQVLEAAGVLGPGRPLVGRARACGGVDARRRLDADDGRAVVGEHARRRRAGHHPHEVEHLHVARARRRRSPSDDPRCASARELARRRGRARRVDLAVVLADRRRRGGDSRIGVAREARERAGIADRAAELGMLDVAPVVARRELRARDDLVESSRPGAISRSRVERRARAARPWSCVRGERRRSRPSRARTPRTAPRRVHEQLEVARSSPCRASPRRSRPRRGSSAIRRRVNGPIAEPKRNVIDDVAVLGREDEAERQRPELERRPRCGATSGKPTAARAGCTTASRARPPAAPRRRRAGRAPSAGARDARPAPRPPPRRAACEIRLRHAAGGPAARSSSPVSSERAAGGEQHEVGCPPSAPSGRPGRTA